MGPFGSWRTDKSQSEITPPADVKIKASVVPVCFVAPPPPSPLPFPHHLFLQAIRSNSTPSAVWLEDQESTSAFTLDQKADEGNVRVYMYVPVGLRKVYSHNIRVHLEQNTVSGTTSQTAYMSTALTLNTKLQTWTLTTSWTSPCVRYSGVCLLTLHVVTYTCSIPVLWSFSSFSSSSSLSCSLSVATPSLFPQSTNCTTLTDAISS